MSDYAINIVNWNVRGLNDPDRRTTMLETISDTSCHIVCLLETKLAVVDSFIADSIGGQCFQGFAQRPAMGTRGGILILWNKDAVELSNFDIRTFSISALVKSKRDDDTFKMTVVYGPTDCTLKIDFFASCSISSRHVGPNGLPLATSTKSTTLVTRTTSTLIGEGSLGSETPSTLVT
jgi:hypothetical protein